MSQRPLLASTALTTLAAGLVANPPPGHLLGHEIPLVAWGLIALAGVAGGTVATLWPNHSRAWIGAGFLALPALGPIHAYPSLGFGAALVAAVAFVLHLEALASTRRLDRWRDRLSDPEALGAYRSAYRRAYARLTAVLVLGLATLVGLLEVARQAGPTTFSLSLEASHPEGLAGIALVLAGLAIGGLLAIHGSTGPQPDEAETPQENSRPDASPSDTDDTPTSTDRSSPTPEVNP